MFKNNNYDYDEPDGEYIITNPTGSAKLWNIIHLK